MEEEEEEEDSWTTVLKDVQGLPMLTSLDQRMDPEVKALLTAVIDSKRLLSRDKSQEAVLRLHIGMKMALGYELTEERFAAFREKAAQKQDAAGSERLYFPAVVMPPAFPSSTDFLKPPPPTVEDMVGQILKLLCLCFSTSRDWASVCKYADVGLECGLLPKGEDLRLELLLRRGIALSHLAAGGCGPAAELQKGAELQRAARDLQEVLKFRPCDKQAKRGLENVKFLQAQLNPFGGAGRRGLCGRLMPAAQAQHHPFAIAAHTQASRREQAGPMVWSRD